MSDLPAPSSKRSALGISPADWIQFGILLAMIVGVGIGFVQLNANISASIEVAEEARDMLRRHEQLVKDAEQQFERRFEEIEQSVVRRAGVEIVQQAGVLSSVLGRSYYVTHAFGGGATVQVEPSGDEEALLVTVDGQRPTAYGGLNVYGNKALIPEFRAVALSDLAGIQIKYRYPSGRDDRFFLRLKNQDNFETVAVMLPPADAPSKWTTYVVSAESPEFQSLCENCRGAPYLLNLAFATELEQSEQHVLELDEIRFLHRE